LAPEIFLIRDSGFFSTGPNFSKSTFGQGSRPSAAPVPPVGAAADHLRCGQLENCSVLADENPCRNRLV